MAERRLALITFLDGHSDGPVDPGYGVPGGGQIDNSLPPGAVQLPVFPFDPTAPDNSLPPSGNHPSTGPIRPGLKFVVKWLACKGLILVPDNSLPGSGNSPDNSLPGSGGRPDQGLPPSHGRPDQGLPGHGHPDNTLPSPGARPDQGLPSTPARPDQGLPPSSGPKR